MVRLFARRNGRAISREEIAITSGIPLARIIEISQSLSWDGITIPDPERFCAACHFDPTNPNDLRRQRNYAYVCNRKKMGRIPYYLRASPYWLTEFLPLIQRLRESSSASSTAQLLRTNAS